MPEAQGFDWGGAGLLTVMGLGVTFVALATLAMAVIGLGRYFRWRDTAPERALNAATPVASAAKVDDLQRIAAIAAAIALAQDAEVPRGAVRTPGEAPTGPAGAWVVQGRERQMGGRPHGRGW